MKDTMPDISFERSMNHNYMILSKCDFFGKGNGGEMDYRARMLLENNIPGLLSVTHRLINGESRYYYEINSLQSLDRLYDKNAIKYDELKRLLAGCVSLFDRLEEYLLDGAQIIIKPGLIYVDVEKMEPYFVCYPEYEGDVRLSFMEFVDDLLTKIDHTDERAVMLGYQVYRYTRNPNYVISGIGRMLEHVIVDMARSEEIQGEVYDTSRERKTLWPTEKPDDAPAENAVHSERKERRQPLRRLEDTVYSDTFAGRGMYDEEDGEDEKSAERKKSKVNAELIGGIFCVFLSLCAGGAVLASRLFGIFKLPGNGGLYLSGAAGMSFVAAVLLFLCHVKKRRQEKELESLRAGEDDSEDDDAYYSRPQGFGAALDMKEPLTDYNKKNNEKNNEKHENQYQNQHQTRSRYEGDSLGTVCLGEGVVEERVLFGRMNGKEVSIKLDRLPMTVGKLASVADFVINDTAVSKMHARFEEHDGRVYVCDLNSTNGTVRNGVLLGVNQSVKLEPGDRLRFGRTCFTYC